MNLLQKIKQAFSNDPGDDTTSYPTGKCGYNGKTAVFTRLLPYGLCSLEPEGSFILLINSQGQEAVKFGIPSAMQQRLKNLSQGEVAIYNTETGVYVYLKSDGTVEINADTIIDGDLNVTGNVTIDGNLEVSGSSTLDATEIEGLDFSSHVHGGVDTGSGTSGGPQ